MRRWPLWLFLFSLALRLIGIAASILWYDEAFTAIMAKLPFPQMLAAVTGDVHPPLWYLIEWVIAHTLGASELTFRLPAALAGAGSTIMLYDLVKRLGTENQARWASALLAIMPGQLYYSQEARMYALLTFLTLFGANAVLDRRWFRVGASMVLLLMSQNLGAIYAALLGGWSLWASRGKAVRDLAIAGAFYLPQGLIALRQFQIVKAGFWLPPPGNFGGALYYMFFTTFFVRLPEVFQLHAIALSLLITATALFVLRSQLKRFAPLMVLAFAPSLILYGVSAVYRPILLDRALLPAGSALVGLWGATIPSLPQWSRKPLAAIALPMLALAIGTYYTDPAQQRAKVDPMAEIVKANWQAGDAIYHTHLSSLISFDWQLPDYPAYILPESGDLAQSLSDETKAAMGLAPREFLPQALRAKGYKRLWLISGDTVVTSFHELQAQRIFIQVYPVIQEWVVLEDKFEKITLYLLRLQA